MTLRRASILTAAGLVTLSAAMGCARGSAPAHSSAEPNPAALVWPPAPARARLQWAGAFSLPGDLGLRTGFWRRARRVLFGGPDDRLVRPQGITAVDGALYLTDPGRRRVLAYDLARKRFTALAANAQRPWTVPTSVAATADGLLFVADATGNLYRLEAPWDTAVALEWPGLPRPVAVAVDVDRDRVYVLDAAQHHLVYGTLAGVYRGTIGRRGADPGEFNFPTHLAVAADGSLFITDAMNFRVQRLAPDGSVLAAFGQLGDGTGDFAKPKGVAIDSHGVIYVVDAIHDVVQLFDGEGRFLMHVGGSGQAAGQFWLPNGIAIDPEDRVYVADSYNRRVQIFAPVGHGGA